MICPIMRYGVKVTGVNLTPVGHPCIAKECAWYDGKQCAILTIASLAKTGMPVRVTK